MANPKSNYYWSQLRAALTAGSWGSATPAKAFKGTPVSWSELFRKFHKYNPGFKEVVEVASCTQHLSLLIAGDSAEEQLDGGNLPSDHSALGLGVECMISDGRSAEAEESYSMLKNAEVGSTPSDSRYLALAYFAYALDKPEESINYLAKVRDLAEAQSRLKPLESLRSVVSSTRPTGSIGNSSSFLGSFASLDTTVSIAEISNGNVWAATEVIRSVCLLGMCYEKTKSEVSREALSTYFTAIISVPALEAEIARSSPANPTLTTAPGAVGLQYTAFTRYRETWRWVEHLLWRAIVLAARTYPLGDPDEHVLWTLLAHYQACSAHWPPTFRPAHRATVASIHLRALVLKARVPMPAHALTDGKAAWVAEARHIVRELRDVLSATTHFPRARERNTRVEDLIDLTMAVWEASGAPGVHTGWIMDILWWATRLTFNAPRIFRHMTRVAEASGDMTLAARTLRLYAQVVGKARQAGELESADTDANWVDTLVAGARMLCRAAMKADPAKGERGIDEAREAGIMLAKARERLPTSNIQMLARVELAEGVWETTMAIKEADHLTRANKLKAAIAHFEQSIEAHSTPSAQYHLALALSRPIPERNLEQAILHARAAVEEEPGEIRYWHLLGLLLVASEDITAAREVLEIGAAITDEAWVDGDAPPASVNGYDTAETRGENGDAHSPAVVEPTDPIPVLHQTDLEIPPAAWLLHSIPDHPILSPSERFEQALQLRMTQLAATELADGAEGAGDKWLEVFTWVAEQKGVHKTPSQRTSVDTSRSRHSSEGKPDLPEASLDGMPLHHSATDSQHSGMPPITVQPPSPSSAETPETHNHPRRSLDETGKEKEKGTAGKKVQKMLQDRVKKGQQGMSTISKKIGHGVSRRKHSTSLQRTTSFGSSLGSDPYSVQPYQASSIHSRRFSPFASTVELLESKTSQTPPPPPPAVHRRDSSEHSKRSRRQLSDLWLMSAATFRRSGKIEQAKSAIQEAEVLDDENPGVWVQLGLYYAALKERDRAIQAFNKALFINCDHIPANVHLAQAYLSPPAEPDNVDLAVGILTDLTRGAGWDVAEAWFFLAKAHGLRGARDRECECLCYALELSQGRLLREIGVAIGWFL